MRHLNGNGFADRLKTSGEAKRQLLQKFASAPKLTDPIMQERLAAREAISTARDARRAEREALKAAELERIALEAAALEAAEAERERAEIEAREADMNNRVSRVVADEIERKAERDRRYAARKARQR